MTQRFHRLWALVVLTAPGAAYALGLGEIHLQSGLNQPLSAQIELIGASADELTQLRASVASRETFLRYGVDRPGFLSSITFKVGQDAGGRPILIVHSAEAVTEPFVTFLVDVNWPRGKLTREYTLLLDPPVYEAPAGASAPAAPVVQAPLTSTEPKAAPIVRERPPARETTASPVSDSTPAEGGTYRVVPNDTLSGIARRTGAASSVDLNRAMIGIFRANPRAFDGNINRLRRGATLSIPPASDLEALSARDAARAVHEQMEAWRQSAGVRAPAPATAASAVAGSAAAPAAAAPGGRLKLVMPKDAGAPVAADAAKPKSGSPEAQASEAKRLLDLKNAELAKLQAAGANKAPPAKVEAAKVEPGKVEPGKVEPGKVEAAPAAGTSAAAPGEAASPPVKPKRPKSIPVAPVEPSLFDSLSDLLLPVGGGLVLLAGGLLGWRFLKKRRSAKASDALGALDEARHGELQDDDGPASFSMRGADGGSRLEQGFDGTDHTSTMSSETAINLEHADPLAEADFHMAYGLYDQAADIVKLAMEREPERRDLRLKLLEVYFVWSNKDAFLDVARKLARDRDHAPAGEWDKVAIMGRQIAPEEPLFADGTGRAAAAGGVDLDLEADGHAEGPGMDLEFLGDDDPMAGSDIDLDLHKALGGHDGLADTGESPALRAEHIEFDLDSTRERPGQSLEPTQERPAMAFEQTDTIDITGLPPVPAPAPAAAKGKAAPSEPVPDGGTVREALSAGDRALLAGAAGDQTAEIALDDLDFEIEQLNATAMSPALADKRATDATARTAMGAGLAKPQEATRIVPRLDVAATGTGDPTRIAPRPSGLKGPEGLEPTRIARHVPDSDATASLNALSGNDIDFDLEQLAATLNTGKGPAGLSDDHDRIDFDLSEDSLSHAALASSANGATAQMDASELAMGELEPVTLSEVGTKIDLARAYMDMGDPDGARSILEEVLHEGSASQRQEAQRLIGGLPG